MEPESLLAHSQVPATFPYLEPPRSSPYPLSRIPEVQSYYIPPIYAWVSKVVSFPQVKPLNTCPFPIHATRPALRNAAYLSKLHYYTKL